MKIINYITIGVILVCITEKTFAQASILGNTRPAAPPWILGWDGSGANPGSLEIHNDFTGMYASPINFFTSAVQQATLDINGNFSIGWTNTNNYFGIYNGTNVDPILWHKGDTSSIFVGVGAGNSSDNDDFYANVFVGKQAGYKLSGLYFNTAVGWQSLYSQNSCPLCEEGAEYNSGNTAIGFESLYSTQAYGGCTLGVLTSHQNLYGCSLVAIGEEALYNNIGDINANQTPTRFSFTSSELQSLPPGCSA